MSEPWNVEAVKHAAVLRNRNVHSLLSMRIPHKVLFGSLPELKVMRTFGYETYVHVENVNWRSKFSNCSELAAYLGHRNGMHHVYLPKEKYVIIIKHICFDETIFPLASASYTGMDMNTNEINSIDDALRSTTVKRTSAQATVMPTEDQPYYDDAEDASHDVHNNKRVNQ